MPILYLLAPNSKTQAGTHRKDFHTIIANGIGPDYGISTNLIRRVVPGMRVVVFDRDRRLQAEGVVAGYSPTSKAGNGVQRYDIQIQHLEPQQYSNPPRVNRFGVAIS